MSSNPPAEQMTPDPTNHTRLKSSQKQLESLRAAGVPAVNLPDPCRSCDEPCADWPGIMVDNFSTLLGSTQPFARMCIVSTGLSNWPHSVTDEAGSLEHALSSTYNSLVSSTSKSSGLLGKITAKFSRSANPPGLGPCLHHLDAQSTLPDKLTTLSGSNFSRDHSGSTGSILIFPDFKIIHGVSSEAESSSAAVQSHLLPQAKRFAAPSPETLYHKMQSFPLPYRAVILICEAPRRTFSIKLINRF